MADGLRAGIAPADLYVAAIRPAVRALLSERGMRARLGTSLAAALLADIAGALPVLGTADGRVAVLCARETGLEALDARVAMDFLHAGGWQVECLDAERRGQDVAESARRSAAQLAVVVATGAADLLRLGLTLTALRRLPDPPVILLCDFSAPGRQRFTTPMPMADALVHDPETLVRSATRLSPALGRRRWGVALQRTGDALVLSPTGCLDATGAARLIEVAVSRGASFARLVVDLRDLAEIEPAGLLAAGSWPAQLAAGTAIVLVADAPLRARLAATPGTSALASADSVAEAITARPAGGPAPAA